jgi:hypothetical protein
MNKAVVLVADPEILRSVPGDGMHLSAGHAVYRNEPAIIEVGDPAARGDPNSPAFVLKEGVYIAQQSPASLPINRSPPFIPSVQPIESAKPNGAIPGRQDGPNGAAGQNLLHRDRWDGKVAKAAEAITSGDPDIAFTILKEACNEIAGEAVRPREQIRPSLVDMQEAPVRGSDPQTAIAIPEQPGGKDRPPGAADRMCLDISVNELSDSAAHGDQEFAFVAFDQTLDVLRVWDRIEFRRIRLPSPQPRRRSGPEIASAVLI